MKRRYDFPKSVAIVVMAVCGAAQAAGLAHHWGYQDRHAGPPQWDALDRAFETCAKGQEQSPINIGKTIKVRLPALDFQYGKAIPSIVNNGHTVQIDLPAGSLLKVGGRSFELVQFHFHTPSEETIAGKHLPMVAHFVHRDATGKLGVVGVLIKSGKRNAAYGPIFAHLPRTGEKISVEDLVLDLPALLPPNKGYYAYRGSLTTPPCSEGVSWMVLKSPIVLGEDQIREFRRVCSRSTPVRFNLSIAASSKRVLDRSRCRVCFLFVLPCLYLLFVPPLCASCLGQPGLRQAGKCRSLAAMSTAALAMEWHPARFKTITLRHPSMAGHAPGLPLAVLRLK
jgi:carbonic anhydrase